MSSNRKPKTINPDEVDPSVYYYDEVYDEMQHAQGDQTETDKKSKQQQGSKYIQGIVETAERRKSEKEIRKFKKYTRDREEAQAEGILDNSDVYVSESYEKKLKEMQETIKKHSDQDEGRTLNSFKRTKYHDDGKSETLNKSDVTGSSTTTKDVSDETHDAPGTSGEHHKPLNREEANKEDIHVEKKAKVTRPKSIEERREYLRVVLAKRTVGEVLKAAQERYRQRKSKA